MRNRQSIVYENETFMRELEIQRRELEQQIKEIEKREAQLDLKRKQLSVLNEELDSLINLNNTLIAKECRSNHELQEARKVLIEHVTKWETKSAELCSLWKKKIQDSEWYPYKHVTIDKKRHEVIDEDYENLRELKDEWGKEVHDAVATASLEMNQYNASGRYPVRELWNFKEGRQAILKEAMQYVLQKLKALKSAKRRR
ncbi:hypothetical protein MKX01_002321 [Papaver californicum]|nr:hypothetical protein MKX01_002321 [Papaver californicum]